ncbi:choice-of-anchor J family PEP-CTERM protein [Duganella qianjiadongensis]|uniref:PEP-CTERM sorting domain-containing protein n=1 Tax=Duganella qianjiadongensis TaxID=2692176 RepID=A0ABW9VH15_9BURK|nr:choice-of-anchor J domain-containing protein [Duganella qianjiadongensis]MYM37868.1 PEP-CTERM sorting domain-containing protein [Duganella qianjiadongensis]
MNLQKTLIGLLAAAAISPASAAPLLNEGFNDIGTLSSSGWFLTNNSSPAGQSGWFQSDVLGAAAGPANSAIGANYLNAAAGGAISNWLITPELAMANGNTLNFSLRLMGEGFQDTVEVYYSLAGASHNVGSSTSSTGDFVLLGTYSATNDTGWTNKALTLSGLGAAATGRFAFRYVVGDTNAAGDAIAIDSVNVSAVPEPASALLLLAGLGVLVFNRKRARWLAFAGASATALVAQAEPQAANGLMTFPHTRVMTAAELQLDVTPASGTNGLMAYKDPVTGQLTGPTAEQAAELAALSAASTSSRVSSGRIAQGAKVQPLSTAKGGVGRRLDDSKASFAIVQKAADGTLVQSCMPGEDAEQHLAHDAQLPAAKGALQ